jgi:hypothetical protein
MMRLGSLRRFVRSGVAVSSVHMKTECGFADLASRTPDGAPIDLPEL